MELGDPLAPEEVRSRQTDAVGLRVVGNARGERRRRA